MISYIHSELNSIATPERKKGMEYFFKHEISAFGVSNPDTQNIGREVIRKIKSNKWYKSDIWNLAEELFKNGSIEESLMACQIVFAFKGKFEINDFQRFESWVSQYIDNWAECDTFCNKTIGEMLFKFPELQYQVRDWSGSSNLWMRRAAAVSFIYPAKRNLFVETQWEIALLLLEDKEDMVQKGYGWMLKVLSGQRQEDVFEFVMKYKSRMPRTALRYAIEKMPESLRRLALMR